MKNLCEQDIALQCFNCSLGTCQQVRSDGICTVCSVLVWGKHQVSIEAVLCTTEEEDMFSLLSALISWWQTEVPTRGAELIPQREGNTPCCPKERESHLSNCFNYYNLANWHSQLSVSPLLSTLKPSLPSVAASAHQCLRPPTVKEGSFGFLTLNPASSSFHL